MKNSIRRCLFFLTALMLVRCGKEFSQTSPVTSGDERPIYSLNTLYVSNGKLTYLKKNTTGSWTTQDVERNRLVIQAAIDMVGQTAHVSYDSNATDGSGVRYANNSTGTFQNSLSVPNTITNGFNENAIAVDSTGLVHIAHDAKPSISTQSQRETYGQLNSWTNATTDILTDPITANAYFAGSSFHANGAYLIMQGHPKRSGSPVVVNIRTQTWGLTSTTISTAGSNNCTAAAWGGEGKVTTYGEGHAVYHCVLTGINPRTHIGYAHNESGNWVTSSLAYGPGTLPAPARPVTYMDKNNTLHVVYEQGGLKYRYRPRRGAWSNAVALPTISGVPSHVVSADSTTSVDIVYVENNTIKHLTNASGSWVAKTVLTLGYQPKLQKGMDIAY